MFVPPPQRNINLQLERQAWASITKHWLAGKENCTGYSLYFDTCIMVLNEIINIGHILLLNYTVTDLLLNSPELKKLKLFLVRS